MKVLHLLDEPWDSGITAYALQTAELQHKSGDAVTVGVLAGKKPEALAQGRGLVIAPFDSTASLRRLLKRPWDLINAHTGRTHTWAVLTRSLSGWPSSRSVPVIRTRGDARPVSVNPLSRFIYRRTAGFVAASSHVGEQYREAMGLGENRLEIIYPSVEVDDRPEMLPADRVGILGRLDPVKGHSIFLEAAAHVLRTRPNAHFFIAGKEANVTERLLRNQAEQLGLDTRVSFLGYAPDARAFMRSCTVGVVASLGSEEVSRACLEWMSVGRPVVATMVGSLPELVEPEETGLLVPPGDGLALAKAINVFLSDPAEALRAGHAGHERVVLRYSARIQLEKTREFFRKVAAQR